MLLPRAHDALERAGVALDVHATERAGHARAIAEEHGRDVDAVFVLGGDGTVMEVAGALAGSGIPIGVLPGGTGNLLARALGIPRRVERAVPALLQGSVRRIDLGRLADGRRFAVAAGVGIDARMVAETPVWAKRHMGVIAYALIASRAAIGAVLRRDWFTARVTVDGETLEREAVAVMIANFGAILDERITLGPGIACDDGVLDLCLYSPRGLGDALRIGWRMMRGDFRTTDELMLWRRGRRIEIHTVPELPCQADGDLVGRTPVVAEVEPLAADLLEPGWR
jgi:YegS/Rv2252/BmrU family lipid kinase